MRLLERSFLYTACCAVALSLPGSVAAQQAQVEPAQSSAVAQGAPSRATLPQTEMEVAADVLPDSPGAEWAKAQQSTAPQADSSQPAPGQAGQTTDGNSQEKPQRPVGTAAAEAPRVSGITAAEPAGVAIAPAKQHRVRIIVLKVGAIVGAGAALGTVIALTAGTSSKPPGAH